MGKHNARRAKQPRQRVTEDRPSPPTASTTGDSATVEEEPEESFPMEILNVQAEERVNTLPSVDHEEIDGNSDACGKEVKHLESRLKNVLESIQLSNSNSNPKIYQENVLFPVRNCVTEWLSIQKHYPPSDEESDPLFPPEKRKQVSLLIFQLIQYSIQCGPLAGSKPGYFKRCGGQVAKMVYDYLITIEDDLEFLGFTEKQTKVIATWKSNAQKAAANDKPPSKSQLKKQSKKSKK